MHKWLGGAFYPVSEYSVDMNSIRNLPQFLDSGLGQMSLKLSATARQQLLDYVALLEKWNKVYNLTAVRDPQQMITHHILDSLSVLPYLQDVRAVLDVGTGAGLPGIPLAIARPDITFKLLDSQQKKIIFVQHVVGSLQITNVTALCNRVESLPGEVAPDMIISRAFASIKDFVSLVANCGDRHTQYVAMKGRKQLALEELAQLPSSFKLHSIAEIVVPELDAERCLVFLTKQGD